MPATIAGRRILVRRSSITTPARTTGTANAGRTRQPSVLKMLSFVTRTLVGGTVGGGSDTDDPEACTAGVPPDSDLTPNGANRTTAHPSPAALRDATVSLFVSILPLSYERMNDTTNTHRRRAGSVAPNGNGTREQLVQGALRVLRERGLAGASSREIARASGVNLAGITYHFGSKDALLAEALLEAIRGRLAPAMDALRQDAPPPLRMMAAVQALQAAFEDARDLLPVYLEALVHAPRADTLRESVQELFAELRGFLADQIVELKATGFLPAWVEPEAMATLLVATGDGIALHAAVEPNAIDHRAVAAQAVELLLSARSQP